MKHTDSILQSFEHFCQTSSKSMLIIFNYTVSRLVNVLRHMAETLIESSDIISCLRHGSIQDRLCRTCCWAVLCSTCSQHITSRCL